MQCSESNLALYLYGEMGEAERAACDAHLAGCERCRDALAQLQKLDGLFEKRVVAEPAPEVLARCRARLDEALAREQFGWRSLVRNLLAPGRLSTAPRLAAVGLLVAFGFSLGWVLRPLAARLAPSGSASPVYQNSLAGVDLGNARISSISQVASDPATGGVRITLNAEHRVTLEGSLDDPRIRQVMIYALRSYSNPGIRLDTLDALRGDVRDRAVRSALLYAVTHDGNAGVRLAALRAVQNMGWSPETRQALLEVVHRDNNCGVRVAAIDQLVKHAEADRDQALLPVLSRLAATDTNAYVRLKSLAAIHQLESAEP